MYEITILHRIKSLLDNRGKIFEMVSERVFLEVRTSNVTAYNLYESLGFNEIGVRPGYYPAYIGREDALVLAKEFL